MEKQKLKAFASYGLFFLLTLLPWLFLATVVTQSLLAGLKWGFIINLVVVTGWRLGSLLMRLLRKFRSYPLDSRSGAVMASSMLVLIGLSLTAVYFDVDAAGKAAALLLLTCVTCAPTGVVLLTWLIPDIDDLKSDDDKMHYLLLVLFTHAILTAIAFLLILYFKQHLIGSG